MCQTPETPESSKTCGCEENACRVEEKKARKAAKLVLPPSEGPKP